MLKQRDNAIVMKHYQAFKIEIIEVVNLQQDSVILAKIGTPRMELKGFLKLITFVEVQIQMIHIQQYGVIRLIFLNNGIIVIHYKAQLIRAYGEVDAKCCRIMDYKQIL